MTSIVGITHGGVVSIGSDSAGSNYSQITTRRDTKIFRLGDMLIGGCGSFRMLQLLRFAVQPPKHPDDMAVDEYMVLGFVEACRAAFKEGGFTRKSEDQEYGGEFLVGYRGRLFHIEGDFQVGEADDGYDACGSGEDTAKGVLYATQSSALSSKQRIQLALEAGERHNVGVRGPFQIFELAHKETAAQEERPLKKEPVACNRNLPFLGRAIRLWRL